MNDTDDEPLTDEERRDAEAMIGSTDLVTQLVVRLTGSEAVDALVVAEGVLARLISAYAQAQQRHDPAGLDKLLVISARHVRELADQYWVRLEDCPDDAPGA
jgi:hypothetical protein